MPDFVNTIFRTEGNYAQSHTSEPLSTLLTTAREPLYTYAPHSSPHRNRPVEPGSGGTYYSTVRATCNLPQTRDGRRFKYKENAGEYK